MRVNLNVPYAEKDEAKRHGARWDAGRRTWYVEDLGNLHPFMKWIPEHLTMPHVPAATVATDADISRLIQAGDRDLYGDKDRLRADPLRKKALRKAKKKMRIAKSLMAKATIKRHWKSP